MGVELPSDVVVQLVAVFVVEAPLDAGSSCCVVLAVAQHSDRSWMKFEVVDSNRCTFFLFQTKPL